MRHVIYAKIAANKINFRNIQNGTEEIVTPEKPFTTVRMLVGEYIPYEMCFKKGLLKVRKKGFFSAGPSVVVHATEMNDGGLCEIERRILQEVALTAGAKRALVYEGPVLSDQEVAALVG